MTPWLVAAVVGLTADPAAVAVPFTLLPSRHAVVDVTVDGNGPYKFVFDTGSPINLIDAATARAAGLAKPGLLGLVGAVLTGDGPPQPTAGRLAVGRATAADVPMVVMDHPAVATISRAFGKQAGGPIRGIIGFPFFARYATAVDYQRRQLTLTPTGYKPSNYMAVVADKLAAAAAAGDAPRVAAPAGLWGLTAAKPAGDRDPGVVVTAVSAGGPAAAGGLKVGDRVLTVDGRWTDTVADVAEAAGQVKPGRAVDVEVVRDGRRRTLRITPADGL